MSKELLSLRKEMARKGSVKRAQAVSRFFKTGKGEYGEGDVFIGVTVPESRLLAKKYANLSFADTQKLFKSRIHEERLIALLILVHNFQANPKEQEAIVKYYLKNTNYINNWDLVDLSADKILGTFLFNKPKEILYKLARSKNIWERRIAIIATYYFIKQNQFNDTLQIADIMINDTHDLIQKAVGWMLREVGNRSLETEETFLKKRYKKMPRTMLRYAIEKFPEKKRHKYLKGLV